MHIPCTEVNFSCGINHHAHILPCDEMILNALYIKEVSVWSPEELSGVGCHVEWLAEIMLEPRIIPPLAEKYIHGIFLYQENKANILLIG